MDKNRDGYLIHGLARLKYTFPLLCGKTRWGAARISFLWKAIAVAA
ncbi:MAG: hypothetical protein ACRC6M_11335 [Microcystaceae cyanobacterium]